MCWDTASLGDNCTAWVFINGAVSNAKVFNNVLTTTLSTQGYQALIYFAAGYSSASGGNQSGNAAYNNTLVGQNGTGISCECAGILTTTQNTSTQTGFVAENNIFVNFLSSYAAIQNNDGTLFGKYGTGIDYNEYFNTDEVGYEATNNQHYYWAATTLWKVANGTNAFPGYDVHGNIGNPLLNYFHIPQTGSAAIGAGVNLTSLGITALDSDIHGPAAGFNGTSMPPFSARPATGAWTIGASNTTGLSTPPPNNWIWNGPAKTETLFVRQAN
jgi:hypothetical protein